MNRRDRFIAELRDEARRKGLSFRAETWRGKGGHMVGFDFTLSPVKDLSTAIALAQGKGRVLRAWNRCAAQMPRRKLPARGSSPMARSA